MLGIFGGGPVSTDTTSTGWRAGRVGEWTFRLDLAGVDVDDETQMDHLFEAGCDDATFATDARGTYAVFHREAPAPETAVLSAVRDVESVGGAVRVLRVENDDEWLTGAEIAERTRSEPPEHRTARAG